MRILHSADWHLGRIFHNIHLTDDQAHILDQFVALVKDTKPDVVLIAGDVYDRSVPPPEAVTLLNEVLSRILLGCRVPVIITAGNHDSPERLGFGDKVMSRQNLHVISQITTRDQTVTLADKHGPVCFCPIPYAEPAIVREQLADDELRTHEQAMAALVQRSQAGLPLAARRVAIAHAFVAGGASSESERPLSIGGIATVSADIFSPFHYAALGHLHRPQQLTSSRIRYSGSLLKYSFAEADQPKSVSLAELDADGSVTVEEITLAPRRNVRCLEGYLDEIIAGAANDANTGDYIMVTLKDSGAILDPMGKLRQVYPHVLHLERAQFGAEAALQSDRGDYRRQSETDLFTAFYAQTTGNPPSTAEMAAFKQLIDDFNRREREALA